MKTVFAVDDSPTARASIQSALSRAQIPVQFAVSGEAALKKLGERTFSAEIGLFLLDVNMPGIDGLELTREIRKLDNYCHKPILILTTESDPQKKEEGRRAGASGWIEKPFDPDELSELIKRFIQRDSI